MGYWDSAASASPRVGNEERSLYRVTPDDHRVAVEVAGWCRRRTQRATVVLFHPGNWGKRRRSARRYSSLRQYLHSGAGHGPGVLPHRRGLYLLLVHNRIPLIVICQLYDLVMPVKLDLVGIYEIAAMIGVSRQRVDKISRTDPEFPTPVAELHAGRIWKMSEIEQWARQVGREIP